MPAPNPTPGPLSTPPAAAEGAPTERGQTQSSNEPETATTPELRPVEIEIEDGELETELDRVHSHGGPVRLRIRSDQFVVVEGEKYGLTRPIPAGGEALIEFDTFSTQGFKVELRRRKGVLVLRVHD